MVQSQEIDKYLKDVEKVKNRLNCIRNIRNYFNKIDNRFYNPEDIKNKKLLKIYTNHLIYLRQIINFYFDSNLFFKDSKSKSFLTHSKLKFFLTLGKNIWRWNKRQRNNNKYVNLKKNLDDIQLNYFLYH